MSTGRDWRDQLRLQQESDRAELRPEDIEFQSLGPGEWRVVDRALPHDDAFCLLGFVRRVDDGYELTMMSDPWVPRHYPTQAAVRAGFMPSGCSRAL